VVTSLEEALKALGEPVSPDGNGSKVMAEAVSKWRQEKQDG
jgi:hypothetical protein